MSHKSKQSKNKPNSKVLWVSLVAPACPTVALPWPRWKLQQRRMPTDQTSSRHCSSSIPSVISATSCSKFWLHSRYLSAPVKPAPDFGREGNHDERVFEQQCR